VKFAACIVIAASLVTVPEAVVSFSVIAVTFHTGLVKPHVARESLVP
jgi:hypothetical protein